MFFQQNFIMKNAQFILEGFLGMVEALYQEREIVFPKELLDVNNEYRRLKTFTKSLN